jgi:hypothetical protein
LLLKKVLTNLFAKTQSLIHQHHHHRNQSMADIGNSNNVSSPRSSFDYSRSIPIVKTNEVNVNARGRCYVNPVLKPVENLDQWKLVKEDKRDDTSLAGRNVKKSNVRDRRYVNPVLKPIENLVQWKLVSWKGCEQV